MATRIVWIAVNGISIAVFICVLLIGLVFYAGHIAVLSIATSFCRASCTAKPARLPALRPSPHIHAHAHARPRSRRARRHNDRSAVGHVHGNSGLVRSMIPQRAPEGEEIRLYVSSPPLRQELQRAKAGRGDVQRSRVQVDFSPPARAPDLEPGTLFPVRIFASRINLLM